MKIVDRDDLINLPSTSEREWMRDTRSGNYILNWQCDRLNEVLQD